jgi:hypothetical protein
MEHLSNAFDRVHDPEFAAPEALSPNANDGI